VGPAKSCSNIMVVENASGQQQQTPTHSYNYVVTAHKPTAVTQVAVGSFTSPTGTDLLVAKSSRLEIHSITPDGLEAVLDVPIYGRISALKLFKPASRSKSLLFLLTERYKFCVLEYSEEGKLVTVANGDVEDAIGRPCECGHICVVDEEATMIGLHMYDGHLKIIPIDEQGRLSEQAFNVRLEELKVVDLAFVDRQVLAVLYEDTKGARGVRSYQLGAGGVLEDGPMRRCVLLVFTRTFARSSGTPVDSRPSDSHLRHMRFARQGDRGRRRHAGRRQRGGRAGGRETGRLLFMSSSSLLLLLARPTGRGDQGAARGVNPPSGAAHPTRPQHPRSIVPSLMPSTLPLPRSLILSLVRSLARQVVTKYDGSLGEPGSSSQSSYGYGDGRAVMMKAHAKVGEGTVCR